MAYFKASHEMTMHSPLYCLTSYDSYTRGKLFSKCKIDDGNVMKSNIEVSSLLSKDSPTLPTHNMLMILGSIIRVQ